MSADPVPLFRRQPSRPQERGERRREAILAAVEEALSRTSLADLSVAEIARGAGLPRSAFYFYFASKQAAVFVLLQDMFRRQTEEVGRILDAGGDHREQVAAALGAFIQDWRRRRPLVLAAFEARVSDAAAGSAWDEWIDQYVDFLAAYVLRERESGAAPAGPDAHLLARALIGSNERMLEHHLRLGGDEQAAVELHEILVHVWLISIYGVPLEDG